ncbi:MAG TPA: DUF3160 domain-containing protein [Pyrinomonadaceae bacterium]|nr:DUF3160 domain-containing protein [Pyrinomonadaceae bacterium]
MRRREICAILLLFAMMATALGGSRPRPPAPQTAAAAVKPYKVSPTLAEVVNLRAFSRVRALSPAERKALYENLFVSAPTSQKQLFHIYEDNDYRDLPSFVTTDAVLHLYHIFYDFTLRTVEEQSLAPVLRRLTEGMLEDSARTMRELSDPQLKQAALKNAAYFAVALRLLDPQASVPAEALAIVQTELDLIKAHAGFKVGAIFPYVVDYSQFNPRGHYTRSEALKRYFGAMMWYGLTPFAVCTNEGLSEEQIRQSLLLTRSLYRAKLEDEWATIYEPTSFYVGAADDVTPAEWKTAMEQVFGADAAPEAFADAEKFAAFADAAQALRPARIQARTQIRPNQPAVPDASVQLRFMGQRYIPDSEIMQRLSVPLYRVFPSGLDVMAVIGSARAREHLDTYANIYNPKNWPEYLPARAKLVEEFAAVKQEKWTSNLYWNWLYALKALLEPVPQGHPSFMLNAAWADKSLNTALGSWAELRHDTILYGKQSGAEMGDGEEPASYKGYVEPNVLFWDRLLGLTRQSREGLTARDLLSDQLKDKFEQFEELLATLKTISEKELRGERLTDEEYDQIRHIGGTLEYLTLSVMTGNPDTWEMVNETDKDMAVVADVHTGGAVVLEEGVGHANEILVVVPVEGKLVLTRGAVFSYYEFQHPSADRLTDEKWQRMLNTGKTPPPPVWTKSFLLPGQKKVGGRQ